MRKLISALSFLTIALLAQSAFAQTAKSDSAAKMLPPGQYQCKMGSYSFRDCEIVSKGEGVELVITSGLGHFIEFRAELLPSDDKGQMTLLGTPTSPQNICDSCSPGDKDSESCSGGYAVAQACQVQPLVARLKVSGGGAKGTLMYYINRPSYKDGKYAGYFKLGNTLDFAIKKKK
jgi:hypothetical protein